MHKLENPKVFLVKLGAITKVFGELIQVLGGGGAEIKNA